MLFALLLSAPAAFAQSPAPACGNWVARLVAFQGAVTFRRAAPAPVLASAVTLNETFCVGDMLEVGANGRAALQLPDQTVVRLDQATVVTFAVPRDEKRTWLDILKGALHIISRDPRALRVVTPFANAGIEGTEFLVQVGEDSASVLVFEGRVKVENALGAASAAGGQQVLAKAGSAPVLQQVVRPRDQVVWTLYYPPTGASADALVAQADQRLAAGRLPEAESDLALALSKNPGSSEVLARQSVIALTRNDPVTAKRLADEAVANGPTSTSARLAQSYVQQSAGNLEAAVATLEAAAASQPGDALVRARLAELYLASGDVDRSEASARQAVAADPALQLAHTILGFAELTRVRLPAARAAFDEAIRLDASAPLPRLGLGLAKIRDGDLAAGREEIETAVILDPNNSLVRSYMGKAYYEEKRDKLAASQLEIAKELDPNDPTPWFYDAIRKQTINQPIAALTDLQRSSDLNDRRAVYRSTFLLDDDAASRNASVSAVYDELGFEALAVIEGAEALSESYSNSSAHRLLANAYARLPRYDISRASESLQAQIRQPLSVPPTNLRESIDDLAVVRDSGPSRVAINEYNSLFTRDDLRIQAEATVGSRDTWGDQFVASGLSGRFGFSIGQLHYESEGFRDNRDTEKDVYDGFLHFQASPEAAFQVNGRSSESSLGYTYFDFDDVNQFPIQIRDETDAIRLTGRNESATGQEWIFSAATETRNRDVLFEPDGFLITTSDTQTTGAEIQTVQRIGDIQIVGGFSYVQKDEIFADGGGALDTDDATAYVYAGWGSRAGGVRIDAGLSLDMFDQDYSLFMADIQRTQLNPKLGILWRPTESTTVRAAGFTSVRRPLIGNQTIEPTTVMGFNQYFTGLEQTYGDDEGTISRKVAAAVDQRVSETLFLGIEGSLRRLEVPFIVSESDQSWREKAARIYGYKTIPAGVSGFLAGWEKTLTLAGEHERLNRPYFYPGPESILDLTTQRVPIGVALFSPSGFSIRVTTSYVRQEGDFTIDLGQPVVPSSDSAWITDASIDYRMPRRLGIVSVGVQNIGDNEIQLVEVDPLSPRVATRRLVSGTFSVVF